MCLRQGLSDKMKLFLTLLFLWQGHHFFIQLTTSNYLNLLGLMTYIGNKCALVTLVLSYFTLFYTLKKKGFVSLL